MDNAEATVATTVGVTSTEATGVVDAVQATETETQETQSTVEAKYTEEDVQRIVQDRIAREQVKAAEAQKEAQKLAKLSAQEKAQYQLEKANERIAELEREQTVNGLKQTATGILSESGISADDSLLAVLVTNDAETTQSNIKSFIAIVDAKSDELLQAKLKGTAPKVVSNPTGSGSVTREDILAIADTEARQAAIAQNLHLFQ